MEPPFNQLTTTATQKQVTVLVRTFANTQPGDIVFDGFVGTGMTGIAAGMCGNPEKNYVWMGVSTMASFVFNCRITAGQINF